MAPAARGTMVLIEPSLDHLTPDPHLRRLS
jgi:hypothetical protein